MYRFRRFQILRLKAGLPYLIHNFLIVHLFKDTITADSNEIIVVLNLECTDLRSRDYDIRIATIALVLSLNISNCARN